MADPILSPADLASILDKPADVAVQPVAGNTALTPDTLRSILDKPAVPVSTPTVARPAAKPVDDSVWGGVSSFVAGTAQYLGDKLGQGNTSWMRGIGGSKVMSGQMTYEDAQAQYGTNALDQARSQRIQSWEQAHYTMDLVRIAGEGAAGIPPLLHIAEQAIPAALVGGGIGAAQGFVRGALAGTAGGPAAEATVPAGAAAGALSGALFGASFGGKAAVLKATGEVAAGDFFMQGKEAGIPDNILIPAALTVGAISGALNTVQAHGLTAGVTKTIAAQMKTAAGKALVHKVLESYAAPIATQAGLGVAQQIAQLGARTVTGHLANNKGFIPTHQQMVDGIIEAAQSGALQGAAFAPVLHVGGAVIGKALNKLTPAETVASVNAVIEAMPEALKKKAEEANKPAEQKPLEGGVTKAKPTLTLALEDANPELTPEELAQEKLNAKEELDFAVQSAVDTAASPEARNVIDMYARAIRDPQATARFLSQGEIVPENIDAQWGEHEVKQIVATQVLTALLGSPEQTRELVAELEELSRTGRSEFIERKKLETAEDKADAAFALEFAKGNKTDEQIQNEGGWLRAMKRTGMQTVSTWNGVTAIIGQHFNLHNDPNLAREARRVFDTTKEEIAEKAAVNEQVEHLLKILTGDDPKVAQKLADSLVSGGTKEIKLDGKKFTFNEAITIHNQMQDPELVAGLRKTGYTFDEDVSPLEISTQTQVREALGEDGVKLANGFLEYYRQYYDRVNPWHIAKYGVSLRRNKHYSGYARRLGYDANPGSAPDLLSFVNDRRGIDPQQIKDRVSNSHKLAKQDAVIGALQHIAAFEHAMAWDRKSAKLTRVFSQAEMKEILTDKYGKNFNALVQDAYKSQIGTQLEKRQVVLHQLDTVRRAMGTAAVGLKPLQFFKQWTAIFYYLHELPGEALVKGVVNYFKDTKKADAVLSNSAFLANRPKDLRLQLTNDVSEPTMQRFKTEPSFVHFAMMAVEAGDMGVIRAGMWATLEYLQSKEGGGLSQADALAEAERISNQTQSSSTPSQRTALERSGSFGQAAVLFRKQPLQAAGLEADPVRRAISAPTKENVTRAARAIAINRVAQGAFQAVSLAGAALWANAISGLSGKPVDDKKLHSQQIKILHDVLAGPLTGAPLYGDTFDMALTNGLNAATGEKSKAFEPSNIGIDALKRSAYFTKESSEYLSRFATTGESPTATEVFKALHNYARGPALAAPTVAGGGGLPLEPLIGVSEDIWQSFNPDSIIKADQKRTRAHSKSTGKQPQGRD